MERQEFIQDEHLDFLDEVMESGQMTSFKVTQLLMHKFPLLSFDEVNSLLTYWIFSYDERKNTPE